MNKRLFLIDGNSFCYRAYYAIRSLANSKGQPTNAVYGFIAMLNKIIKDEKPDFLGVAFDLKGPTFRHKKFEDYKAARKPMPDDLVVQLPVIKEILGAYKIAIFELQGYEADDILATLAKKASGESVDTFIVTGDKDALQLVGPHVKVYNTNKEGLIFDSDKVKERFQVGPDKIIDLIALMGDSSDNIPGVTGIGEKTAIQLISEFGSFEKLFKNLDKIKSESKRELLKKYEKQAQMSRELAMLDYKVPINTDLEKMKTKDPDKKKLIEFFKALEFRSLLNELIERKALEAEYVLIRERDEFADLVRDLAVQKTFAFDFETTSPDPMQARLVGVSFCWEEGKAFYLDFRVEGLDTGYCLAKLKSVFEDETILKVGQNIKYEKLVLLNYGINLKGIEFDTMVASYLLNPSKLNHNLSSIAFEHLNHKMKDIAGLIGKGKKAITMDKVEIDKVCNYCCEDSDVTFRLKNILEKQLREKGLLSLFTDVEIPLVDVLSKMEFSGISIDCDYLSDMSSKMRKQIDVLTTDIYEMAGGQFNINSPKQLQEVLFERLKLPPVKKTKTGYSTDEEVLNRLASKHSLPKALLEYRELAKLKSTYLDALPKLINPKTNRLHTSFNQTVTSTGRLSSSDPNLQNIPIKTEVGRKIRKAFVPKNKGSVIISADYSQIELRILAGLSKDETLTEAFKKGLDIHTHTASLIFNIRENAVSKKQRSQAKTVNFGIVYGMSAYGLSRDLNIDVGQAQEFIDAYFNRYPKVKLFMDDCIAHARENGFATTLLNRRRYMPEINSQNIQVRNFAERTAINTPIQGTAADLIKLAMIGIQKELEKKKMRSLMVLQVHDELVFEVPEEEIQEVKKLIRDKMENIMKLSVPIKVNCSIGDNWLELRKEQD